MKPNQTAILTTNKITVASAAAVILAAAALSFTALFDLFNQIGLFHPLLAWLFPLLFDLAEVSAAVSVLNAKLQGENDRLAWRLVIGFTVAGIVANTAHAVHAWHIGRIDSAQLALGVVFTSLFPLSVAWMTQLLKNNIERQVTRAGLVDTLAELTRQIDTARDTLDKLNGQIEGHRGILETVKRDIDAAKSGTFPGNVQDLNDARQAKIDQRREQVLEMVTAGMTEQDIAHHFDVTVRTIRRDIKALNGHINGNGVTQ